MKTKELRFRDKTGWGDGPWNDEPDKVQFTDEATGLPCLIVRSPGSGALCGYVGVSEGHPFYNVGYNECVCGKEDDPDYDHWTCDESPSARVDVHGGLTYSDFCMEGDPEHGICHVVEEGEDDKVWWLGFDTAHAFDYAPAYESKMGDLAKTLTGPDSPYRPSYKTIDYVREEIANLARQLSELR